MITRKIGKILRGKVTPYQIISATVLGALAAGSPGWGAAPAWNLLLFLSILMLNANLFIAGITWIVVSLVTLALTPVYFWVGTALLDGPLGELVALVVNAPVGAWFGWEYYVTLPGLVVAGLLGLGMGIGLSRAVVGMRRKLGTLEAGSDKYQAYANKGWVKVLGWLLFGGLKGKQSWEELAQAKGGSPVRVVGIIFAVSCLVLVYVGYKFLDESIVTSLVREQLEQVNGATVEIGAVRIVAGAQQIEIAGLAMANPEALGENRFAATRVVAALSGLDLLAKKVVIERLEIEGAVTSQPRTVPGRRIGPAPEKAKKAETGEGWDSLAGLLDNGEVWMGRLQTVQRAYERFAPGAGEGAGEAVATDAETDAAAERPMSLRERLAARVEAEGYRNIAASGLVRQSPRLTIKAVEAMGIEVGGEDTLYDLVGTNLATEPWLVEGTRGALRVARSDGGVEIDIGLPWVEDPEEVSVTLQVNALPMAVVAEAVGSKFPLSGGQLNIRGEGTVTGGRLALPLAVEALDTTVNAFGTSAAVKRLPLAVEVGGTLGAPQVKLPKDALEAAVKAAGKDKLLDMVEEKGGAPLRGLLQGLGGGGGE